MFELFDNILQNWQSHPLIHSFIFNCCSLLSPSLALYLMRIILSGSGYPSSQRLPLIPFACHHISGLSQRRGSVFQEHWSAVRWSTCGTRAKVGMQNSQLKETDSLPSPSLSFSLIVERIAMIWRIFCHTSSWPWSMCAPTPIPWWPAICSAWLLLHALSTRSSMLSTQCRSHHEFWPLPRCCWLPSTWLPLWLCVHCASFER